MIGRVVPVEEQRQGEMREGDQRCWLGLFGLIEVGRDGGSVLVV